MAGQIIKRKNDKWLIRIFLGRDTDGKRKYFNKTINGTKKDAQKFLTAKLREKDLGVFVEPASMSLNKYLDKWLDEIARPRLRESTYNQYVWVIKKYIREKLGQTRLCDLQGYQIQTLYGQMLKQGLSSRTVRYTHTVLSTALKQAVKWKMIIQNLCDLCELPRKERKEMQCLTSEETARFLETARSNKWFALFLIAIETGMRPSEYLGLKWKDIDYQQKHLSVQRSVFEKKGGGYKFTEPKTSSSRRIITLSNTAISELKNHRRKQLENRMKVASAYTDVDLVFATALGTPLIRRNLTRRHFKPLLVKANINDIRIYDLRHTTATMLLLAGENPKVVSERLGHSSVMLTLDTYSHVLPSMQENATIKLERIMFGT